RANPSSPGELNLRKAVRHEGKDRGGLHCQPGATADKTSAETQRLAHLSGTWPRTRPWCLRLAGLAHSDLEVHRRCLPSESKDQRPHQIRRFSSPNEDQLPSIPITHTCLGLARVE